MQNSSVAIISVMSVLVVGLLCLVILTATGVIHFGKVDSENTILVSQEQNLTGKDVFGGNSNTEQETEQVNSENDQKAEKKTENETEEGEFKPADTSATVEESLTEIEKNEQWGIQRIYH